MKSLQSKRRPPWLAVSGFVLDRLGRFCLRRPNWEFGIQSMTQRRRPIAQNMPTRFADQKHDRVSRDPIMWIGRAEELEFAAKAVWKTYLSELEKWLAGNIEAKLIGHVSLMLYGLSIENYLKARLVQACKASGSSGKFNLKTHKLLDLCEKGGIGLCTEEAELLERLEHFVSWAGRYPISLKVEDMYARELSDGGEGGLCDLCASDCKAVESFLARIRLRVEDCGFTP
jgi:hypothetical protein